MLRRQQSTTEETEETQLSPPLLLMLLRRRPPFRSKSLDAHADVGITTAFRCRSSSSADRVTHPAQGTNCYFRSQAHSFLLLITVSQPSTVEGSLFLKKLLFFPQILPCVIPIVVETHLTLKGHMGTIYMSLCIQP